MSKKDKTSATVKAEEKILEEMGEEVKEAQTEDTTAEKEETNEEPVVYCGPSIRNIVRQYTVFDDGIPETLRDFFDEKPIAKTMLIPLSRLAEMRSKLEDKGTPEAVLYRQIMS